LPTPEQCVDYSEEGPLALEFLCNRCGLKYSRKFDWACVNPNRDPQNKECDGILLSRIVECAGCGAVDDYTLADTSLLRLTGGVLGALAGTSGKGRIILGVSKLWDGSIPHRPSQALARLRRLAAEHPDRAEAFRRLGNACERWGLMGEAVTSWKKALDLDPADVEAAYSLATYCWGPGDRPAEGLAFLRRGLQAIPKAAALGREVREWGTQLVRLLPDVLEDGARRTCRGDLPPERHRRAMDRGSRLLPVPGAPCAKPAHLRMKRQGRCGLARPTRCRLTVSQRGEWA
jgi:hypothetical protein